VNLAILEIKILNFFFTRFCASSAQNIAANREQIEHIFCISRFTDIMRVKSVVSHDFINFFTAPTIHAAREKKNCFEKVTRGGADDYLKIT
jgi:hypothetical protein